MIFKSILNSHPKNYALYTKFGLFLFLRIKYFPLNPESIIHSQCSFSDYKSCVRQVWLNMLEAFQSYALFMRISNVGIHAVLLFTPPPFLIIWTLKCINNSTVCIIVYGCEIWNLILCARVSSLRRPDKHYVTQAVELAKLEIIQDEKKNWVN